jgi:hypothetical protein
MKKFIISQEELAKVKNFKQFYSNLNKISGSLDTRPVYQIQNQQLIIHFSYSGYSGRSTYANCKVNIDCGKKDAYWFQTEFEDFLIGINKFKTGDLTIDYDAKTSQIAFISGTKVLTKPATSWLSEAAAKDIINMLKLPEKPIANMLITEDMLNICSSIKSAFETGDTSDAISFDETIQASDNASIIEYDGHFSTGSQFLLNISALPLLKKLIGSSVDIYKDEDIYEYYINTPDYEFFWTYGDFNIYLPNKEELAAVTPDATNISTLTIKTQDLLNAIKEFDGIWSKSDWRWGQVNFQFNRPCKKFCVNGYTTRRRKYGLFERIAG